MLIQCAFTEFLFLFPQTKKDTTNISLNLPDIQPDYKPVHMPIIEPRKKQGKMLSVFSLPESHDDEILEFFNFKFF